MRELTFGSLFAGIGGLDLGLERAGMRCMWQVEIDDYATSVLERHWPDVRRFADIRDCGQHNLLPVDLVCGGFPCQDVSLAGKRAGLRGRRTTLWAEYARIVREIEPTWVLAENVPGLRSSDVGAFFGTVVRELAACGHDIAWDCIPAAAVGAPHRRDRVFIVAHAAGTGLAQRQRHETARWARPESSRGGPWQVFQETLHEYAATAGGEQWAVEPDVGRVADGIPDRVDRMRCLGNAVVPQVAEWIGRRIIECDARVALAQGHDGEEGGESEALPFDDPPLTDTAATG